MYSLVDPRLPGEQFTTPMTTSASTRFVVSTVGLISMSLSFRKFLEVSAIAIGKVEFSTKNLVQSFEVLELPHDLGTIRFPSGHLNFHLRKVCLLLLLLIFEQSDRLFWAVCHFLVLSGFRVVICIDAWERIRSARDVLPSWSETLRGTFSCMTTSVSTRFVVSTVGLISMSLSFRNFWRYQQWFHCQP